MGEVVVQEYNKSKDKRIKHISKSSLNELSYHLTLRASQFYNESIIGEVPKWYKAKYNKKLEGKSPCAFDEI